MAKSRSICGLVATDLPGDEAGFFAGFFLAELTACQHAHLHFPRQANQPLSKFDPMTHNSSLKAADILWSSSPPNLEGLAVEFAPEFILNCACDALAPIQRYDPDPWVERWAVGWVRTRQPEPWIAPGQRWAAAERAARCFLIFGLHLALPSHIAEKPVWDCSLRQEGNWVIFALDEKAIAAQWTAHAEISPADLERLPSDILGISFSRMGITLSPELNRFTALQSVSFSQCGRLADIQSLRGIDTLTELNISGALVLEDFSPLCGLPGLRVLGAAFMDHAPDEIHLRHLPNLRVLDLEGNRAIRDLAFLHAVPGLLSLAVRRTRIGQVLRVPEGTSLMKLQSLSADGVALDLIAALLAKGRLQNYLLKSTEGRISTNLER
jgi:hypothetical protein